MEYNIEFQIAALVIVGMLMAVFFYKKRVPSLENRIYGYILCYLFLICITDISSVITLAVPERHPELTLILARLYLMEMIGFAALLTNYTVALSFHGKTGQLPRFRRYYMIAWDVIAGICMIISMFLDIYAGGYGRHVYTTGDTVTLAYGIGGIAVVAMLIFTCIMRNEIPKKKQLPIFGYAFIVALTTMIQKTNPYYLLMSFSIAVSVFFMYFTLENPDLKLIQALNEAKNEAESANRAKTAFLASMSHEIRTPINAVIGMNEMIIREAKSSQIEEYAVHIQNATESLLRTVNNVLDFAKIDSGKMQLKESSYSLVKLLMEMNSEIENSIHKKNLSLQCEVQRDLPCKLYGDEMHIKQIVWNLLSNAVKFTQQGYIILSLSGQKVSDHNVLLQIRVSDTGIGIKKEEISKITESFLRMEEDDSHTIEGTGLGLAITSGLLKMMDSKLSVTSEYGKGSSFSFEIMQRVEEWNPIGDFNAYLENSVEAEAGKRKTVYAEKAHVLVVDDNELNLSVMRGLLKRTGVQLVTATSGAQAIDLAVRQKFDIVFLDYMMPKMDGMETFRQIRKIWERGEEIATVPGTPFIVVTANAVIGAKEMYLENGFTDYLSKPVYAEQLEMMFRKYLPRDLWEERTIQKAGSVERGTEDANPLLTADNLDEEITQDGEILEKQMTYFQLLWPKRKACLSKAADECDLTDVQVVVREMYRQMKLLKKNEFYTPLCHLLQKLDLLLADGQNEQAQAEFGKLIQLTEAYIG